MTPIVRLLVALLFVLGASAVRADDGYRLWLRYDPLPAPLRGGAQAALGGGVLADRTDLTLARAAEELERGLAGLLGGQRTSGGAILVGTPADPRVGALALPLGKLGNEGYLIRTVRIDGKAVTVVAANAPAGALYGSFALLRLVQTGAALDRIDLSSAPGLKLRVLNQWDNLDGHVERGYAGNSIWDWWKLPAYTDPRYTDYARANASIGINGTVLNNVNANALSLTAPYIAKAAALADLFRPWGIKVYLSARFSAPIELGGLKSADPLDPAVAAWWRAKADEIYRAIPDFGGFLVKANSEGQPGPRDYHRSHADGANVLARAVAPHGGIVMYRAFVYAEDNPVDRAKQAYDEFKPLDGKFADNVLVQVKNGPLDFQPREPFHPLFGAMPKTPLMIEFQITKEYLGQATHLTYLGPLFTEVLGSDTYAGGKGTTVADVVEGKADGHRLSGIAGVANIGTDRDWSGSTFNQADWYAFGRFAWNPRASAEGIAREWAAMTFTPDPAIVQPIVGMMMPSREAAVDYMTPLGLAHIMGTSHHYGPAPWVSDLARPEWNPAYYHRADAAGIGFDRTAHGSNAIAQYARPLQRLWSDPRTTPDADLLWFHHLPWDYRMKSGRILWDEMALHYQHGVDQVAAMRQQWGAMKRHVDAERFAKTADFLAIQQREAEWWRDACLLYFGIWSRRPLPAGIPAPAHDLPFYKGLTFPFAPGGG
ncbi:alpha-glucuronidase family glycosyl hydrolase [uncultured Sphingomonas sp.]|uniref:alpha-glucuronidase family glycosyl hydrolase n=1 Tax=uncultured Sphingomonas sp. TaxID=158754 RepID=UPI0025EFF04C|nr:alpha-glucuronidase family glycosyl hydrolase [uncultured Sphingomonas sp.]